MVWDSTIKLADIAIIFATLIGPILAVQAQKYLEARRGIAERRLTIFRTLMATRSAMLSPAHVEALNAVPVEFYGKAQKLKRINETWKLYLDHHSVNTETNDAWMQKRLDLFLDLLHNISSFLGYEFTRPQLGRDIYSPKAHDELETEQTLIRKGLAKLFNGETVLPMAVKEFPGTDTEESIANEAHLRALLVEWLEGARPVKIEASTKGTE